MENREVEKNIKKVRYHHIGDRTTIANVTLNSGWEVIGIALIADPSTYNNSEGEKLAYENALDKLEPLEAFYKHESKWRGPHTK